jgi:lysophospholipase L1-like esterase
MDSASTEIPVQPVAFEHPLTHFAQSIAKGQAKVVAIGSSTTAGEGNIAAYPGRLLSFLQSGYLNANITMSNKGIGGQEAPQELARFDTDVIAQNPDLVIWQVGTNCVWQPATDNPPSFDDTTQAIRDGLVKLKQTTQADIILMDLQYVPALLTPGKKDKALAMVDAISGLAREAGVNVFRRFAFMQALMEIEGYSFDELVDPTDNTRLHDSELATQRVAWAVKLAIDDGVRKAQTS